jgi:hypothetical protein
MSQTKYDQRTESNIDTLQADFAERVRDWLAEARKQGLTLSFISELGPSRNNKSCTTPSLITAALAPWRRRSATIATGEPSIG